MASFEEAPLRPLRWTAPLKHPRFGWSARCRAHSPSTPLDGSVEAAFSAASRSALAALRPLRWTAPLKHAGGHSRCGADLPLRPLRWTAPLKREAVSNGLQGIIPCTSAAAPSNSRTPTKSNSSTPSPTANTSSPSPSAPKPPSSSPSATSNLYRETGC